MAYGGFATRNVINLTQTERAAFMSQQHIFPSSEQITSCSEKGYVIVRADGIALGVGMLRRVQGAPTLESQFPKNWT